MNLLDKFENRLEKFNENPTNSNKNECYKVAIQCLKVKLNDLGFEFNNNLELFQQAVIGQIISDEQEWLKIENTSVTEDNLYKFNNKFLLLLNTLKNQ